MMDRELLLKEEVRVLEDIIEEKDCYINLLEQCLIDIGADLEKQVQTKIDFNKMDNYPIEFVDVCFKKRIAVLNRNSEELKRIKRVLKGGEE